MDNEKKAKTLARAILSVSQLPCEEDVLAQVILDLYKIKKLDDVYYSNNICNLLENGMFHQFKQALEKALEDGGLKYAIDHDSMDKLGDAMRSEDLLWTANAIHNRNSIMEKAAARGMAQRETDHKLDGEGKPSGVKYVCDACGTACCYFVVSNTCASRPCPDRCPYSDRKDGLNPNWRPLELEIAPSGAVGT